LNYFNYFTEIEDAFVRRRGKHLFLSPMDWALMETWKEQGIPLHIVLRGLERSFDSYESRPRKRTVKSLLYCQEEVEAQYAEWLEARVGSSSTSNGVETDSDDETHFSFAAVSEHLKRCRISLLELVARQESQNDFSEALVRAISLLAAIEADFGSGATPDTRKLEDSLIKPSPAAKEVPAASGAIATQRGAPAPITPLEGDGAAGIQTDPAKMSYKELRAYERARRAEKSH